MFPVILGAGKRLFGTGALPRALKLVDTTTSGTGVAIDTYQHSGQIALG